MEDPLSSLCRIREGSASGAGFLNRTFAGRPLLVGVGRSPGLCDARIHVPDADGRAMMATGISACSTM